MNLPVQNVLQLKHSKVCCCCLKDGCFKNIYTEYFCSGQREIYEIMLKETFGIQISPTNSAAVNNHLICEDCIAQLRVSAAFKNMVVNSERTIKQYLDSLCNDNEKLDQPTDLPIKTEMLPAEEDSDHQNVDDGSLSDDEILADIKKEARRSTDEPLESNNRPKKKITQEGRTKMKKCKIKSEECKSM